MSMSNWLQVYGTDGANDYRANCKTPREAAILCLGLGKGTTVRNGKTVVWTMPFDETGETSELYVQEMIVRSMTEAATADLKEP